jgi:hypothetical protein
MEARLQELFNTYLDLARAELRPQQVKSSNLLPFELLRNKSIALRHLVDEIEGRAEFRELVRQSLLYVPREDSTKNGEDSGRAYRTSRTSVYGNVKVLPAPARCYTSIYEARRSVLKQRSEI